MPCWSDGEVVVSDPNLYDELSEVIEGRIGDIGGLAPAAGESGAPSTSEIERRLEELAADQRLVRLHRESALGAFDASSPVTCRSCGEVKPCPTSRGLGAKYGVTGRGVDSTAAKERLTPGRFAD